jgi:pyridoxal phosphate enzyme (YggS family)
LALLGLRRHTGVMGWERLADNWHDVRRRMADASARAGRDANSVRLVAVTKRTPLEWSAQLARLGQLDQGENYPQDLWDKAVLLPNFPIQWHLIGHLQTNKVRRTFPLVTLVHAVDSLRLLLAINRYASETDSHPRVLLQVNTSGEASKHGWSPDAILEDADEVARIDHVDIAGLMTMAAPVPGQARPAFARLREVRGDLAKRTHLALPELSMGMSGDFEDAILEGATIVRVGSALFEGLA